MSKGGPTPEFVIELSRHPIEDFFSGTRFVVIGPSPNDGIEFANQSGLRSAPIITDDLFQVGHKAFDGFFGGFNQGLKSSLTSVCSGFVAANLVLSDVEAQKIKPSLPSCSLSVGMVPLYVI